MLSAPEDIKRPLSPHIQIYKPQITSVLSILHRGKGILLFGGSILWCLWFVSLAAGRAPYHYVQELLLSPLGLLVLLGWSFSFFYHLCNGIRHLFWDIGIGYEKAMVRRTGWAVIFSSVTLTGITWAIGLMKWEGLL